MSCSMLETSMFLSYAPDTLMKQRGLSLLSIEVEIPLLSLGRGRIQWARNALCKKYKAPTSKKGRVQKHMLKSSKQNRPSGNSSGARSIKGSIAEKKNGGSHRPTKTGRKQTNSTRKNAAVALLSGFRCSTFTKTSCRQY